MEVTKKVEENLSTGIEKLKRKTESKTAEREADIDVKIE